MNVGSKAGFSWAAPTTNTDGSTLADLTGYNIKLGTVSGTYTQGAKVAGTLTAEALANAFSSLVGGTYFAVITAVNSVGNESVPSNEITFTLITTTPTAPTAFAIA